MNDRVTRYYNRFNAVITYVKARLASFVSPSAVPGYYAKLQQVVADMEEAGAGKVPGDAGTVGAIEALRTDIGNIHRTAVAIDPENSRDIAPQFPLPSNTATSVINTADAYIKALTPQPTDSPAQQTAKASLVDELAAHELDPDFVAHLKSDRAALPTARETQTTLKQQQVQDTKALETLIQTGIGLTNKLDACMRNKYTRDADNLRAWISASHLERAPQRDKSKPGPVPPVNPPSNGGAGSH